MKTKTTLLAAIFALIALNSQATTWTVSNNPNSPGQFTSLQAAIDSAGFYDTIMVAGSATSYGDITVDKPLVLVGAGYNNPYGANTTVNIMTLKRVNIHIGPDDSKITGFYVLEQIRFDGRFSGGVDATQKIDNVVIERCRFKDLYFGWGAEQSIGQTFNNDTIRNNFITGKIMFMDYGGSKRCILNNLQIHNNIFSGGYITEDTSSNRQTNFSSTFVRNNLFIHRITNVFYNSGPDQKIKNIILENNIFYAAEPHGCINAVYSNNLTFMCFNNEIPGEGNLGSGNIVDVNPMFANYPLEGGGLSYSHDFTLLPGSPAIGAGTDGTDIGILGGMLPFDVGANPYFPQMMEVNLPSGSSVPAGGTLNVHFKARKQD